MNLINRLFLPKKIKGLDALRFIAVFSVILSHLGEANPYTSKMRAFSGIGREGVTLSFTISGFIITYLTLREKEKLKKISITNFYLKRFLKIFPVLYVFVFFLITFSQFSNLNLSWENITSTLFFYRNYSLSGYNDYVGHLWSLSVEEHFYLFFPLIIAYASRKRLIQISFAVLFIAPMIRVLSLEFMTKERLNLDIMTHCRLDAFAGGILIACFMEEIKMIFSKVKFNYDLILLGLFYILYFIIPSTRVHPLFTGYWIICGMSFSILLASLILVLTINLSDSFLEKILNNRIVIHFGIISYSLYMWQEFAVFYFKNPLIAIPISYCLALISFILIEMPFERLKKRIIS